MGSLCRIFTHRYVSLLFDLMKIVYTWNSLCWCLYIAQNKMFGVEIILSCNIKLELEPHHVGLLQIMTKYTKHVLIINTVSVHLWEEKMCKAYNLSGSIERIGFISNIHKLAKKRCKQIFGLNSVMFLLAKRYCGP